MEGSRRKKRKDLLYIAPPNPLKKARRSSPISGTQSRGPKEPAWAGIARSPPTSLTRSAATLRPGGPSKKLCCLLHWTPDGRWI